MHFEFGEVAFPPRPGEQAGVQPAQRQVDDERDVREVAAEPVRHGALHPRVGREEVQPLGEGRARVGQFAQHRRHVPQVRDERFLGLVDGVGGDGAELAQRVDGVRDLVARIRQHGQRLSNRGQRLVDGRVVRRDLADEGVEILGGRDDVVGLAVQRRDEDVQLRQQAAQVGFAALIAFANAWLIS